MRVLHLPVNIASQASITVRALRDIGLDANGLVLGNSSIQDANSVQVLPVVSRRKPIDWVAAKIRMVKIVLREIYRSDVIHWHFGLPALPGAIDLKWASCLGKPGIVEFWGSDIRIPEIEFADNPYYACAWQAGYEYNSENLLNSRRRQQLFSDRGSLAIATIGVSQYVQQDIFPSACNIRQRLYLPEYSPSYPGPTIRKPLLVHSPTAPICKGTSAVTAALERLSKTYDFDFKLIRGIPHGSALTLMQTCDIFLDQFVVGSHGVAALEAMAFGKPVVCYIKPSLASEYPPDLPIINSTQETLPDVVANLIEDGHLRYELGKRGRAYVEKYHDAHKIARQLMKIYQNLPRKYA